MIEIVMNAVEFLNFPRRVQTEKFRTLIVGAQSFQRWFRRSSPLSKEYAVELESVQRSICDTTQLSKEEEPVESASNHSAMKVLTT